jgi:CBS domain-containing protein
MFSIYGVTGRTYRGTLDKLGPPTGLAAVPHARGIGREGEEFGPEMRGPEMRGPEGPRRGAEEEGTGRQQEATEAYRQALEPTQEREPIHHVYQIMSREVATLGPETRVDDAWRFLAARGFGQAPVLDAARGLVGLVTLADLLSVLNVDEGGVRDIRASRVSDVMTTPVITTDPVSDVRRVARVLLDYDLPGIPVVGESDELVGLVTRGDILRSVIHEPPLSLWA